MGWLLVMFDLPVDSKEHRKEASDFRRALLDDGYVMLQFSIYMRACPSFDRMLKHQKRLGSITPNGGNVRILFVTDKQWEKSLSVLGNGYQHKTRLTNQLKLSEFW